MISQSIPQTYPQIPIDLDLGPIVDLAPSSFVHQVTLINRWTGDEQLVCVETDVDSFCAVWRAVDQLRSERKLIGYEMFEPQLISQPF